MKANKKSWIIAITLGVIICTAYFIAVNYVLNLTSSNEIKTYNDDISCIENAQYHNVADVLFKYETDDEEYIYYTVKDNVIGGSKSCYSATLSKQLDDNGNTIYSFVNGGTNSPKTITGVGSFGVLHYAGVEYSSQLKNYDFEGYLPECVDITYPYGMMNGKKTVHFYCYDTSKQPSSNINYAPVYGLFDSNNTTEAIATVDSIFNSLNYDNAESFSNNIGAESYKKLSASIENTYDYSVSDNFTVCSFGMPIETVKISTEYGYISLDVNSKTIEAGY